MHPAVSTKCLVVHIVILVLDEAVMGIREVREGLVHLLAVVEVLGLPRTENPSALCTRVQVSLSITAIFPVKSS